MHKHIRAHTPTCFSADARHHTLQRETPSPQDPSPCASCAVMAINIEWAATPAGRERELKVTQEEDTEVLRAHSRDAARGASGESQTCFLGLLVTTTRLLLDPSSGGKCHPRNPTRTRQLRCALALLLPTRLSKNVVRSQPVACMDHRQAICPTSSNQALPESAGAWRRLASFRHTPTDLSSKCSRGNPTQPDHAFLQNLLLRMIAPLMTSSSQ